MRVLLIEEGWHSTMYMARALDAAGHAVTVLTANGGTARVRRGGVRWISGPEVASDAFVPQVASFARRFARVLPLTEAAMVRCWDLPNVWPVVEPWQQRLVRDKHALVEYMASRGIATPRHVRIEQGDDAIEALGLPVVVKGSTGSAGKRVKIVETRDELAATLSRARAITAEQGAWIVQEHVASPTFLVGGVFERGRALRIYAGEKIEQYPPRTGGAIHLRSIADPALIDLGLRVFRELAWTGFASADVVRAADGRYCLLEVNPRMWGSLAGARTAGVDLFAPFVELVAGGSPRADLAFAPNADCLIFPRYLFSPRHRTPAGALQALRDLRGEQGRDWIDPRFLVHIVGRLRRLGRLVERL